MADDRVNRVQYKTMTGTDHGAVEPERELPDVAHGEVTRLAHEVAALTVPEPAESGYVLDGGPPPLRSPSLARTSGSSSTPDDAPQPVWDLLDGVERARQME